MNRRGAETGDMMMIFVFGFILFIIVGGVALAFGFFYGQPLDYRNSDASLLYTATARCLSSNNLDKAFFDSFYKNCGISQEVITNSKFVLDISSGKTEYLAQGDPVQCQLQGQNNAYPRCIIKDINAKLNGMPVTLHIIAGSNQQSYSGGQG